MRARHIMITEIPTISRKAPVTEAVRIMRRNFGDESFMNAAPGLIVVDDRGDLAGILSPLSIIKALLEASRRVPAPADDNDADFYDGLCATLRDRLVEDIMDWQPISVTEDADLLDIADLFVKHRFQRVPVIRRQQVVGVIYRSRLMFALASCLLDEHAPPKAGG